MNNLTQNYELILKKLTNICSHIPSFKQIRQPKLSELELVALNLTAGYMSYNSELQLFRTIKGTYLDAKMERSVYNKRRRHEPEIINFFNLGHTNAKAERLNGKIQRFISNNYGMKDKDFALYRIALYFS
jgi:hypothetical protein